MNKTKAGKMRRKLNGSEYDDDGREDQEEVHQRKREKTDGENERRLQRVERNVMDPQRKSKETLI